MSFECSEWVLLLLMIFNKHQTAVSSSCHFHLECFEYEELSDRDAFDKWWLEHRSFLSDEGENDADELILRYNTEYRDFYSQWLLNYKQVWPI